ncbi:MAG: hypothetical protein ACO22Y_00025 [Sediminibacterium sp.]
MKTLQEKYNAVSENRYTKAEFLRDARRQFPQFVTQYNGFEDAVQIFKNRGLLSEKKEVVYDNVVEQDYSPETIRRAVDVELDAMGIDSAGTVSEEDYEKAKKKAMANLEKDCNHYLHLMAKESPNVDKHDKMQPVKDNNKVDTFNGLKKAELKEAIKKTIISILEDKQPINEAAAAKLENYINYENPDNEDLAARIRKGATELANHIAKIEKMYLDTREDIEKIYEEIGSFMAPAVSSAFKEDLKPVMAKYFAIETPKTRRLSPEELAQLGIDPKKSTGTMFSLKEGKIIKSK